ncbi:hypothetical protein SAY86_023302 [Trapa natans]|uniref:C2H2-type domain-containing protein n=1 Tax=Trapa natans TaxID=22666 RepID=A0AAN7LUS2_TRANT|nr:hypothetical protein SAY86_023302 [Trapa natans]
MSKPAEADISPTASGEASVSSSGTHHPPPQPPPSAAKKKRNLPGTPDPDAEVIALSPKTLLATNRFVCEICSKGFQRDQNLQLHRRGHNLPWKLKQRSGKEVKKRVYVCPEPTCVHHDASRALGDLTGIKKHFFRKHGEKKWKCDKCSKKYAVQSDWKAHSKICGTREYKCDCKTVFSRKDSFITHRAFCDALSEESARAQPQPQPPPSLESNLPVPSPAYDKPGSDRDPQYQTSDAPPSPPTLAAQPSDALLSSIKADPPAPPATASEMAANTLQVLEEQPARMCHAGSCSSASPSSSSNAQTGNSLTVGLFASSTPSLGLQSQPAPVFTDLIHAMAQSDWSRDHGPSISLEHTSLCLSNNHDGPLSLFGGPDRRQYSTPNPQPAMSATALLQKAAQMGATGGNGSLLRGLGIVPSSPRQPENNPWTSASLDSEKASIASGLGLGLRCDAGSGLKELMMGPPALFGTSKTTLDFIGLGMAVGSSSNGNLSALISSLGSGIDVAAAAAAPLEGGDFSGKEMGERS